jgi:1-deoxy-D-xylulose-5-phosphate reductoisomerase
MRRRRVVLLGSTGSIGQSAIRVAQDIPDRMEIAGLAAFRNVEKLAEQANALRPAAVCIADPAGEEELRARLNYQPQVWVGAEGLERIAAEGEADMVLWGLRD